MMSSTRVCIDVPGKFVKSAAPARLQSMAQARCVEVGSTPTSTAAPQGVCESVAVADAPSSSSSVS